MNDINFPAGVLQPPLYDASWMMRRITATRAEPSGTSERTASTMKAASSTPRAI